ncbi:AbrB/MazE/SpoVT family DNA-binding domain-containing protein [Ramlibacter sp. WS9]|uniref:AbrB/MazE/SpoVT family DNA-binding domain-containing protein n=1 Tax=Ramlibacter sp. WS9 TaxID=1882741 RepID=UPI00114116D9|nr:AbrB/MazE/SpoVT family DNA-binding domain-containing protein [Ramlibacter sp. WS9]ROZ62016.1 AbrB/MazE/SpoVT family DNA-binding domain-containing protein [Ramlibacter sp. WS9]
MRVTQKGQVTIPKHIRAAAGIGPGSEMEFVVEAGKIIINKVFGPIKGDRRVQLLQAASRARETMPRKFRAMSAGEILEFLRPIAPE